MCRRTRWQPRGCAARGLIAQGGNVADIVLVDVATQQHAVAGPAFADLAYQALAGFRVAVPAVGGLLAAGVLAGGKQRGLHQCAPLRAWLAESASACNCRPSQRSCSQPRKLRPGRAALRILWGPPCRCWPCLRGGRLADHGIGGHRADAVGPDFPIAGCDRGPGLESRAAGHWPAAACFHRKPARRRCVLPKVSGFPTSVLGCVVIFYFVVIPDDRPVASRVGGLQMGIAFVQSVAVAIVLQCPGGAQRLGRASPSDLAGWAYS